MPARDPDVLADPIAQFQRWFKQAVNHPQMELPEAMCLSTVNRQGYPTARMVLLKDVDDRGFTFFTNVGSPKAKDLIARPRAALTFHWKPLGRQVRIEGKVLSMPKKTADDYFATRPRLSQIGSWASQQSQTLESRAELDARVSEITERFRGKDVPAPAHWHGFRVIPARIEFWQERPNRLHDRWLFSRRGTGPWKVTRLFP
jgi:pyridoxamine 5'-phosphate oxidase